MSCLVFASRTVASTPSIPLTFSFIKSGDTDSNPVKCLLRTFTTDGAETTGKDEHVVVGETPGWQKFLLPVSTRKKLHIHPCALPRHLLPSHMSSQHVRARTVVLTILENSGGKVCEQLIIPSSFVFIPQIST